MLATPSSVDPRCSLQKHLHLTSAIEVSSWGHNFTILCTLYWVQDPCKQSSLCHMSSHTTLIARSMSVWRIVVLTQHSHYVVLCNPVHKRRCISKSISYALLFYPTRCCSKLLSRTLAQCDICSNTYSRLSNDEQTWILRSETL